MHRITLNQDEHEALISTFRTTNDTRLRDRCQAILMVARGRRRQDIAEDLQISPRTLQRWVTTYRAGGLTSLQIQWAPGKPPLLPAALAPTIIDWVKQGPQACGLNRANWTYAELADHIYKTHGLSVSETTMREFCHRHDIYPYRPTYRYLRANRAQQEQAAAELDPFKKKPSTGNVCS